MPFIDSIQPPAKPRRAAPKQPKTVAKKGASGARFTKLTTKSKHRFQIHWDTTITAVVSPILFFLALLPAIGPAIVGVFMVVTLFLRLPSRIGFTLALCALLFMAGLQASNAASPAQ